MMHLQNKMLPEKQAAPRRAIPAAYRAVLLPAAVLLTAALLGACQRTGSGPGGEAQTQEEQTPAYESVTGNYEESIAVSGVNEKQSPYYGVMYVSVLDVNGNPGDSKTVYSFKDKSDPENAWSVTGLEIGDIEAEMIPGADVAILFHGDVIRDAENLEFIAVLPDGEYTIRKAVGTTLSNTMSSFALNTKEGDPLSFTKDNCRIEEDAMNRDSGDEVTVYYADGGELGKYPLRIYKTQ